MILFYHFLCLCLSYYTYVCYSWEEPLVKHWYMQLDCRLLVSEKLHIWNCNIAKLLVKIVSYSPQLCDKKTYFHPELRMQSGLLEVWLAFCLGGKVLGLLCGALLLALGSTFLVDVSWIMCSLKWTLLSLSLSLSLSLILYTPLLLMGGARSAALTHVIRLEVTGQSDISQ